jgi:uncharacterized protein (DUF433 family)
MKVRTVGRLVMTNPEIRHGELVFRGTRILVADVLEQVASGMSWETMVGEWRGQVTPEATSEAVRLAHEALTKWPV